MVTWKSILSDETLDWLLEENDPAVRAATLTDLLDTPFDDPAVLNAQQRELLDGPSAVILSKMQPGGYWGRPEDFYIRSKYHGTVWSFLLLIEMNCGRFDPRIHEVVDFLLDHSQNPGSGGFAYYSAPQGGGVQHGVIPCLSGNLIWGFIKAGLLADERIQHGADWLARNQFLQDGEETGEVSKLPARSGKNLFEKCWGKHTCMMGVVKSLKALTEFPIEERTEMMNQAVRDGAEFLLKHRLIYQSHNWNKIANPDYLLFNFPLFWRTDALEMLEILLKLGYQDERMRPALELVLTKRDEQGRWKLEQSFNGRTLMRIEKVGKASKWVTLRALRVLKLAFANGFLSEELK